MLKLKIESTHIDSRGGNKNGREWSRHGQQGMLSLPSGEVRRVEIEVTPGQPLAVGEYQPKDSALYLDKFNEPKFSLRARHWEPVSAAPRLAKAS